MSGSDDRSAQAVSYRALLADPRLLSVTLVALVGTLGTNVAAPSLPAMGAGLAVSDARIGLVITAYTLPAMVAVPVAGVLADLYGRRSVVVPALVVFGIAGTAIALVDRFEAVLLLRGIQGIAFAGIMPLSVTILGDLYGGRKGSAAQGVRVSLNGFSSIIVPAAAGAASALAWNYPFLIYAVALPVVVVVYLVLPETGGGMAEDSGLVGQLRRYTGSVRRELRHPRTATLLAGGGVRDFVRYAVITFVPLFAVRTLDASFAEAGALLSLRGVAYILVAPLAGPIVGTVSTRWALVIALGLGAVTTALLPFAPTVVWAGVAVLAYSVTDAVFSPVIKDAVTDAAADSARAGVVGGMNVLKYGAQSASPAFFGAVLAVAGFESLFLVGAAILATYAGVVAVLGRESTNVIV